MKGLGFLLEKEFKQFARNSFLPKLAVIFPVLIMLIMPWVTTMDVRNILVTVVDNDNSLLSKRLTDKIGASAYFVLDATYPSYPEALNDLEYGRSDVVMTIPHGFGKSLETQTPTTLSVSANAVNGTKGSLGSGYIRLIINEFTQQLDDRNGTAHIAPINITTDNRYNPTLNYRFYMIPALMVMLVIMICGFLPALNIVSEKELGTIEQMNVTPVSRFAFIAAKLIPYWIIGIVVLSLCFALTSLIYGLSPRGSLLTLYGISGLFILTISGFGLLISNYSATMQQAMFVMFFFIMFFILMSGLFTPIESMPEWAQWLTLLSPPRFFIDAMRGVYLKGCTAGELWVEWAALGGFAVALNLAAVASYAKRA